MSRQTIAVSVKASKLTARALAYVVAAVGRKIAKEHRKAQTPHGKQWGVCALRCSLAIFRPTAATT